MSGLLGFLREAFPDNTAQVDAFNRGASQFMERQRLGLERQKNQRAENARILRQFVGVQNFNTLGPDIPVQLENAESLEDYNKKYGPITKQNLDDVAPEVVNPATGVEEDGIVSLPFRVRGKRPPSQAGIIGKFFDPNKLYNEDWDAQFGKYYNEDGSIKPEYEYLVDPNTKVIIRKSDILKEKGKDKDFGNPVIGNLKNKFIDNAIISVQNNKFNSPQTQLTIQQANQLGIPVGEALALLAIESNFGNIDYTGRIAKGPLQVEGPALADVKQYFAGGKPKSIDANQWQSLKQIAAALPSDINELTDETDQITAGLLYLKLIKLKGVAPQFQGAAYNDGYGKFLGIKSLKDVKKFAEGHDYDSVNTYNMAWINLPNYLTQVANSNPLFSDQELPEVQIDNTNRTMTQQKDRTNVTDAGVDRNKNNNAVNKSLQGDNVETITNPILELKTNPDRLGLEMRRAIDTRNTLATFAEIDRITGRTGGDAYKKQIVDLQILDSSLYVMQGYDALNKFSFSGNPDKLNAVLDAFTGGAVLVQPRTDGKFNFITPDGQPIQGATGMTMQEVSMRSMQIFDKKYKEAVTAAAAERSKFEFEKRLENQLALKLEQLKGNIAMIQKAAEQLGFQVTKMEGDSIAVSQGGFTQVYKLETGEEIGPEGSKVPYERYEPVGEPFKVAPTEEQMNIDFGVANPFIKELNKMGFGTK